MAVCEEDEKTPAKILLNLTLLHRMQPGQKTDGNFPTFSGSLLSRYFAMLHFSGVMASDWSVINDA